MIVASLLLILVAVTLLVLGLAGGSSSLLISSIVASLLAAVALVIGARQASAARRTATARADEFGRRPGTTHHAEFPADLPADGPFLEPGLVTRRRDEFPADEQLAEPDRAAAYATGRRDADNDLASPDVTQRVHPDADLYDDAAAGRTSSGQAAGPASSGPDYDQASTVIGGARADDPDESAWRRDPAAASASGPLSHDDPASAGGPVYADGPASAGGRAFADGPASAGPATAAGPASADGPGSAGGPSAAGPASAGGPGSAGGPAYASGSGSADDLASADGPASAGGSASADGPAFAGGTGRQDRTGTGGLADEFDEPDPDDPDDEPLPQAVRPADAVRVARMDAEVLVVDGRPRYHLADCPHLVGRLTEGLPVAEAVELGFSPCGLCRPVDRLVAAAARR